MRFKKTGDDQHGNIVNVISDKGFIVGSISKWHGLFITADWDGKKNNMPFPTRNAAGESLVEEFEFNANNA